jgi:hypothetical protein
MDDDLWGTSDQWSLVHAVMALWLAGHRPAALDSPVGAVLMARCAGGIDLGVLALAALEDCDPAQIEGRVGSLPESDQDRLGAALAVLDADKEGADANDPSPELVDLLGSLQNSTVAEARALVDVVAAVTAGNPTWPADLFVNLMTRARPLALGDEDAEARWPGEPSDGGDETCDEDDDPGPVEPARAVAELALESLAFGPSVVRDLVAAAVRGLRDSGDLVDEDSFREAVRGWASGAGVPLLEDDSVTEDAAMLAGGVAAGMTALDRGTAARALGFTAFESRARLVPTTSDPDS